MARQTHAAEVKAAADYLLSQTKLAGRVSEEVRGQIDAALSAPRDARKTLAQVHKDLQLQELFGVGLRALREYARQRQTVAGTAVRGQLIKDVADMLAIPIEYEDHLQHAGQVLLLARLGKALQEQDPTTEQLVKLAEALAKGQAAAVKLAEQRLAEKESKRARKTKGRLREGQMSLEERVRRIYGIEMPKCQPATQQAATSAKGEGKDKATVGD